MATLNPSAASRRAAAAPMPLPPAVMTATFSPMTRLPKTCPPARGYGADARAAMQKAAVPPCGPPSPANPALQIWAGISKSGFSALFGWVVCSFVRSLAADQHSP